MKMNQWYLYEQEEILGLLLSLVFFIQLMETLGGLF